MKHLIKLPDGNFVNPDHVTTIEAKNEGAPAKLWTSVWVKKDAGYGTGRFMFEADRREELAALLNGADEEVTDAAPEPALSLLTTERLIDLGVKSQVFYNNRRRVESAWMDSVDLTPYIEKLAAEINALFGATTKKD